eukprot:249540_1
MNHGEISDHTKQDTDIIKIEKLRFVSNMMEEANFIASIDPLDSLNDHAKSIIASRLHPTKLSKTKQCQNYNGYINSNWVMVKTWIYWILMVQHWSHNIYWHTICYRDHYNAGSKNFGGGYIFDI